MTESPDPTPGQATVSEGTTPDDTMPDWSLSEEELARAQALYTEIMAWAIVPNNLPPNVRTAFINACSQHKFMEAHHLLMVEFSSGDTAIPPSEPEKWMEWCGYWSRGFVPPKLY